MDRRKLMRNLLQVFQLFFNKKWSSTDSVLDSIKTVYEALLRKKMKNFVLRLFTWHIWMKGKFIRRRGVMDEKRDKRRANEEDCLLCERSYISPKRAAWWWTSFWSMLPWHSQKKNHRHIFFLFRGLVRTRMWNFVYANDKKLRRYSYFSTYI